MMLTGSRTQARPEIAAVGLVLDDDSLIDPPPPTGLEVRLCRIRNGLRRRGRTFTFDRSRSEKPTVDETLNCAVDLEDPIQIALSDSSRLLVAWKDKCLQGR